MTHHQKKLHNRTDAKCLSTQNTCQKLRMGKEGDKTWWMDLTEYLFSGIRNWRTSTNKSTSRRTLSWTWPRRLTMVMTWTSAIFSILGNMTKVRFHEILSGKKLQQKTIHEHYSHELKIQKRQKDTIIILNWKDFAILYFLVFLDLIWKCLRISSHNEKKRVYN